MAAGLALILISEPLTAQPTGPLPGWTPSEWTRAAPEGRYPARALQRLLLGRGHRALWPIEVQVPVLDLERAGGGLRPLGLGGGLQTRSLQFLSADGRVLSFRSLDKDAARALDSELRETIVGRLVQERISALLPPAALVVQPILEAAGVMHAPALLTVLPDHPFLGEFREEFAGRIGLLEERPRDPEDGRPGFAGSLEIVRSSTLFDRLEEGPHHRVDAEQYLRARLLDFLVGDWDRHPDQWRWAAFAEGDEGTRWIPVPRDRDWALARLDGWVVRGIGFVLPHYVGFGPEFPPIFNLSWSGRALDRPLLAPLDREAWEEVTADLIERLPDSLLLRAAQALPPEYGEGIVEEIFSSLRTRRDALPSLADDFYRLLARWADIRGTDEGERARLERTPDGGVWVELRVGDRQPHFSRRFDSGDTEEIRLYLRGGKDTVLVSGEGATRIRIRIVGGGNDDVFVDRTSGRNVHIYDDRGANRFFPAPETRIDETRWREPIDPTTTTHQAPHRDWGSRTVPLPFISYDPDLGLFLGGGFVRTGYGFRAYPWNSRTTLSLGWGTSANRPRGELTWARKVGTTAQVRARVLGSGAEVDEFRGFGNGTDAEGDRDRFRFRSARARGELVLAHSLTDGVTVEGGGVYRYFRPSGTRNEGTLVEALSPLGYARFHQVGALGRVGYTSLDHPRTPRTGIRLEFEGTLTPGLLDAPGLWGGLDGRVDFVRPLPVPVPGDPVLAFRGVGARRWGPTPFHEAALLGGAQTLRGFTAGRFTGEALLAGSAELRANLGDFVFVLPGQAGVHGALDFGRVFGPGAPSGRVHTAWGGGIQVAFVSPGVPLVVSVMRGEETSLYIRFGFLR